MRIIASNVPAWQRDPAVTDVYVADPRYLGYPAPGGTIITWSPAKGAHAPTAFPNDTLLTGYDTDGASAVNAAVLGSSYVAFDTLAGAFNGTAVPWTIVLAMRIPAAPTGPTVWYALSIANTSSNNSLIVIGGASGSTDFSIARRNSSGTTLNSRTFHPGTSNFVFGARYDGTDLWTNLNGVDGDVGIPFGGGAFTGTNSFTVGVSRQLAGGGYSQPIFRGMAVAMSAISLGSFHDIIGSFL